MNVLHDLMDICHGQFELIQRSGVVTAVAHRGRLGFWWLFGTTLLLRSRHFRHAIELLMVGFHFRRVARLL